MVFSLQTSSGSSLVAVNQQLSISFGIALGALLLNLFSASHTDGENIHSAFRYTFLLIGSITFCASLSFHRQRRENLFAFGFYHFTAAVHTVGGNVVRAVYFAGCTVN